MSTIEIEAQDIFDIFPNATIKGDACSIKPKIGIDRKTAKFIKESMEMDGLVKYNLANGSNLPLEIRNLSGEDLIMVDKNGNFVGVNDRYLMIKNHLMGYANDENFMATFRDQYGGDLGEFAKQQHKLRDLLKSYFDIMESPIPKGKIIHKNGGYTEAAAFVDFSKGEIKERLDNKIVYLNRLLNLVKDRETNDIMLFLQIEPHGMDILSQKKLYEAYFNVRFSDTKSWNTIHNVTRKQGGAGIKYTTSLYDSLPESVKEYFLYHDLIVDEEVGGLKIGQKVIVNTKLFKSLGHLNYEDQNKLYEQIMRSYNQASGSLKQTVSDKLFEINNDIKRLKERAEFAKKDADLKHKQDSERWARFKKANTGIDHDPAKYPKAPDYKAVDEINSKIKELEAERDSLMYFNEYKGDLTPEDIAIFEERLNNGYNISSGYKQMINSTRLSDESFLMNKATFLFKATAGLLTYGLSRAIKYTISGPMYMLLQSLSKGVFGYVTLASINSLQYITYFAASKSMHYGITGDWKKFFNTFGDGGKFYAPNNKSFMENVKETYGEFMQKIADNGGMFGFLRSIHENSPLILDSLIKSPIRKSKELLQQGLYNMTDSLFRDRAKYEFMSKYITIYYPHIDTIDQFTNYLLALPKDKREAELKRMYTYVDNEMTIHHNWSYDGRKNTNYGLDARTEAGQPILDATSKVWNFFRQYMKSSNKGTMQIIRDGWKTPSAKQITEKIEQYYAGHITWNELNSFVFDAFSKNEDFCRLLSTLNRAIFISKNIVKFKRKNDQILNDSDTAVVDDFIDVLKDLWFPAAAFERTDTGMILSILVDSLDQEYNDREQFFATAGDLYKGTTKQMTKGLYLYKMLTELISKTNEGQINRDNVVEQIGKAIESIAGSFGYYIEDDIIDSGYEVNIHKTSSPLLRMMFGLQDDDKNEYTRLSNIIRYKAMANDSIPYDETKVKEDGERMDTALQTFYMYNTPFLKEWNMAKIINNDDEIADAINQFKETPGYQSMAEGNIPESVSDNFWLFSYNLVGDKHNVTNKNKLMAEGDAFMKDMAFVGDDGTYVSNKYREHTKEYIWNKLMQSNIDKEVLDAAVDAVYALGDNGKEKDVKGYQAEAMRALVYLDAEQPGAGQVLLSYIMSQEVHNNVYGGKYGFFKKDEDGNLLPTEKTRLDVAQAVEKINAAKKYSELAYITDKQAWTQLTLFLAKERGDVLGNYVTDPGETLQKSLKLQSNGDTYGNKDMQLMFEMQMYTDIMASQGEIDTKELLTVYNALSEKIVSNQSFQNPDGSLTEGGSRALLQFYNYLLQHTQDMGLSDIDRVRIQSAQMIQSEKYLNELVKQLPEETVNNDEAIQTALRFLWGINQDIKDLGDDYISDTVAKVTDGKEPSKLMFSFRTNTSGYKNKNYGKNRKTYYNNSKSLFSQIKSFGQKYTKDFNRFYTLKRKNATPYYSQKEWEAKGFSTVIAGIRGGGSKPSSGGGKENKPGGSISQRRGAARPFVNWGDLDKIPDRKYKPQNRRTRSYAVGSKVRNKLIPGRRRRVKAVKGDTASMT